MANNKLHQKINSISNELVVPKNRDNDFQNKSKYRELEDILYKLKPLENKYKVSVILPVKPVIIGERFYIEATAICTDLETGESESCTGYAREEVSKPKFDACQVTGSATTYARKYALDGLFQIDSGIDPDSIPNNKQNYNTNKKQQKRPQPPRQQQQPPRTSNQMTVDEAAAVQIEYQPNVDITKPQYKKFAGKYMSQILEGYKNNYQGLMKALSKMSASQQVLPKVQVAARTILSDLERRVQANGG